MESEISLERIAAPENLMAAWRAVRGNIPAYRRKRSAGPDGVSLAEYESELAAQLTVLRASLLEGRYQPSPPAQFTLPKKGGGSRQLWVLSVGDRIAQRAAQQVLEPAWEPHFLACSYGYRPGLGREHALANVIALRQHGCQWIVDGDVEACFDNLDHDLLIARLKMRIQDGRVLRLLQSWLDAGVLQAGPPADATPAVTGLSGAALGSVLQQAVDWVFEAIAQQDDPYAAARYELEGIHERDGYGVESEQGGSYHQERVAEMRRRALKRMLAGGLVWSSSWLRPGIAALGKGAKTALETPAGRRLLKRRAMTSSVLAGVASAAALTAYVLNRRAGPAPAGVLQGSPLSPLLANIYLHPFDLLLTRKRHNLVRFADDWVICCPNREEAENAFNAAVAALARLRLKVNREKTRLLSPGERLEWLGVTIK